MLATKICYEPGLTYSNAKQIAYIHTIQRSLYLCYCNEQKKNDILLNSFVVTITAKCLCKLKSIVTKLFSVMVRQLRQRAIWAEARMSQLRGKAVRIACCLAQHCNTDD